LSEQRETEVDFVIVGTGAGGATAARVLSEAGHSILLLEEGAQLKTGERPRAVLDAMRQSFRDMGTMSTSTAPPMPVLQGRLVGGSTAINSAIIWRMPADVRQTWREQHGLAELVDDKGLDATFERIEKELYIADTPEAVRGRNGQLMAEAAAKLGLPGKPIQRNVKDCEGSARCLQGCRGGRRQSMDTSYIPFALERGAQLWPLSRVDRVETQGKRAVGVRGRLLDPDTRQPRGHFVARAKKGVILSAGVLHTPLLLWDLGLRGLVGERFQAHPGIAVVGRFDEPVVMGQGATQAYEVPMRERGFKIESLSMPPELLAARLPGAGKAWQERLAHLDQYAHWIAQMRMRAHGTVRPSPRGRPVLRFKPLPDDMIKVREAAATITRMFFAVGAKEVSHGVHGLPPFFTSPDQAKLLEDQRIPQSRFHLLASHLFGTACAGKDPRRSVVGPGLECHEVKGLYVMDASVFPTNMGVNPQHSVMGVVFRAAERLA
jgi:choline dehydrogenase-like flavoprotein